MRLTIVNTLALGAAVTLAAFLTVLLVTWAYAQQTAIPPGLVCCSNSNAATDSVYGAQAIQMPNQGQFISSVVSNAGGNGNDKGNAGGNGSGANPITSAGIISGGHGHK